MGKKIRIFFGILLCSGLTAVIIGGGVFFARRVTAQSEKRIEAVKTLPLSSFSGLQNKSEILLCAHRGLSATSPENTVEAIKQAGEKGFKKVEFDVRQTADGELVLMHDEKIDRTTNGSGKVSSYTLHELSRFYIDNGANIEEYENVGIPSLSQALSVCKYYGMTPVIELKKINGKGISKMKALTDEFADEIIVMSHNKDLLKRYSQADSDAVIWYMTNELTGTALHFADETHCTLAFKADSQKITESEIITAIENGYKLTALTVDDKEALLSLVNMGVREFITNRILPPVD